jgi:hypothetical protein
MADLININTSVGKLFWVNISGQGKLNYNEDGRDYVATVIVDRESATDTINSIQEVYDDAHKKGNSAKSLGYKRCDAEGKSDDDGDFVAFNFKTQTTYPDGSTKKINVFNSVPQKVELGDVRVGNGSLGAISGKMKAYINKKSDGVSLFLNAIQIVKLEEFSSSEGFGAQEGGDFTGVRDEESGFSGQPVEEKVANPRFGK